MFAKRSIRLLRLGRRLARKRYLQLLLRRLLIRGIELLLVLLLLLLHSLQVLQHLLRRTNARLGLIKAGVGPFRHPLLTTGYSKLSRYRLVLHVRLVLRVLVFGRFDRLRLYGRMVIVLRRVYRRGPSCGSGLSHKNDFLHAAGVGPAENHVVELRSVEQTSQHILGCPWTQPGYDALASSTGRHVDRSS